MPSSTPPYIGCPRYLAMSSECCSIRRDSSMIIRANWIFWERKLPPLWGLRLIKFWYYNSIGTTDRRLDEYERERNEALQWGVAYFESPLNQYLLSKRLTFDWERTVNLMAAATGESGCQIQLCWNAINQSSPFHLLLQSRWHNCCGYASRSTCPTQDANWRAPSMDCCVCNPFTGYQLGT